MPVVWSSSQRSSGSILRQPECMCVCWLGWVYVLEGSGVMISRSWLPRRRTGRTCSSNLLLPASRRRRKYNSGNGAKWRSFRPSGRPRRNAIEESRGGGDLGRVCTHAHARTQTGNGNFLGRCARTGCTDTLYVDELGGGRGRCFCLPLRVSIGC